jgi:SNF2 family DNA or RNA helicase
MGTGITLNAASYAIFIDTPWTSGAYIQACDRIHRIGSTAPVFIYNLICNDTFDERVSEIVNTKEVLSDYIIDDEIDSRSIDLLKKWILELR